MQELIDALRDMAGACRRIANANPAGLAQALQYVDRGALPGIRAGLQHGLMVRIAIERNNNADNQPSTATSDAWNSLWVDPEHDPR